MPELLTVVAICVVILSMIMPTLTQAKKHAQTVVCSSNARQLTMAWRTYASETRGKFVESWQSNGGFTTGVGTHWYVVLERYYNEDKSLLTCPAASTRITQPGTAGNYASATAAWKIPTNPASHKGITDQDYGSYGLNNWLEDPAIVGTGTSGGRPNAWFIDRLASTGGHSYVPVLGDGVWPDQGWPLESDLAATSIENPMAQQTNGYMQRFSLDRHMETVNVSYMDCSTRNIKIPNLWAQQWSKGFVPRAEVR